jgi:hypothetical protein
MKFQEMLTAEMNAITNKDIEKAAYAIQYADLPLGPQYDRQRELRIRLNEIKAAERAKRQQLLNKLPQAETDPYCDEYAWS